MTSKIIRGVCICFALNWFAIAACADRCDTAHQAQQKQGSHDMVADMVSKDIGDGFVFFDDGHIKDSRAPFIGVIVPENRAPDFYVGHYDPAEGYWTPSMGPVITMGFALQDFLEKNHQNIRNKFFDYRFHVVGIVENGNRIIFGSGFCDHPSKNWHKAPNIPDGGGDCYFDFKFDPAKGKIFALSINSDH